MVWPFTNSKAIAPRTEADQPQQPLISYINGDSSIAVVRWDNNIAARRAMEHPVIYRALDKISQSFQQIRWVVEPDPNAMPNERRGKASVVKDLQQLLNSPNCGMTPAMLRYWMALNYALYGRVPYKVGFGAVNTQRPNGLYPLETTQVYARFNTRGGIERYEYGTGETKEVYPGRGFAPVGKPFVDQIWKPGIKGYAHQDDANTPLRAIGLPAEVIQALLVRAIQTAKGQPNVRYLITTSKSLTAPQKEALKQYINDDHGPDGMDAGRIPILQNAGEIEIHKLDNDLSDIHSKMPADDMARLVFGAFGIPIALAGMGAADAAKFAGNYIESRLAFWQDTIIPGTAEPLFQGLTQTLCPPGVRITGDYDSIPALLAGRAAAMADMKDVDFLTPEEKREMFGFAAAGAPETETVVTPPADDTTTENENDSSTSD